MGFLSKLFAWGESKSESKSDSKYGTKYAPNYGRKLDDSVVYFREIVLAEFPQYDVREQVSVTEFVGDANDTFKLYKTRPHQAYKAEWGQPYTFVMSKDNEVKGFVMLGDERSHHEKVKYLIARMYAKKMDIPYISFYIHLPNERDYVIERIKKMLKP